MYAHSAQITRMADNGAEHLVEMSRRFCFGQDTSSLRPRRSSGKKSRKRWRAEFPATFEDKECAIESFATFQREWVLQGMTLEVLHEKHLRKLSVLMQTVPKHKVYYVERRMKLAVESEALRLNSSCIILYNERYVLPQCRDFISYVQGEKHGTRSLMMTPVSSAPYAKGFVEGM